MRQSALVSTRYPLPARYSLYREYPPDFFDLIVVDERRRGSPRRPLPVLPEPDV